MTCRDHSTRGIVYFAQLESGLVKIGHTTNLQQRISAIKHLYGPVMILLEIEALNRRNLEKYMHARFSPVRTSRDIYRLNLSHMMALASEFPPNKVHAVPAWDASYPRGMTTGDATILTRQQKHNLRNRFLRGEDVFALAADYDIRITQAVKIALRGR